MDTSNFKQYIQHYLDKSVPYRFARWITTLNLLTIYYAKVLLWPSFFVVSYVVSLYALNLFIGFISPRVDPVLDRGSLPFF
ncbi:hypothetical protein HZS_7983 [Henneguya salminicola]|nr:hypothetical protein HZS_7983 [Henneguya salminicola]